jgi:hypothetical protein
MYFRAIKIGIFVSLLGRLYYERSGENALAFISLPSVNCQQYSEYKNHTMWSNFRYCDELDYDAVCWMNYCFLSVPPYHLHPHHPRIILPLPLLNSIRHLRNQMIRLMLCVGLSASWRWVGRYDGQSKASKFDWNVYCNEFCTLELKVQVSKPTKLVAVLCGHSHLIATY